SNALPWAVVFGNSRNASKTSSNDAMQIQSSPSTMTNAGPAPTCHGNEERPLFIFSKDRRPYDRNRCPRNPEGTSTGVLSILLEGPEHHRSSFAHLSTVRGARRPERHPWCIWSGPDFSAGCGATVDIKHCLRTRQDRIEDVITSGS